MRRLWDCAETASGKESSEPSSQETTIRPNSFVPHGWNATPSRVPSGTSSASRAGPACAPSSGWRRDANEAKCAEAGCSGTASGVDARSRARLNPQPAWTAKLNSVGRNPKRSSPMRANRRSVAR